jgi:hypothetical protein
LVWAVPVSLAATQGIAFAFSSSRYLDVSVPWVCLLMRYEFTHGYRPIKGGGFPHSEISGSKLTYSSPEHIGVSAVLLRLLVPRHPPCALSNLTKLVFRKFGQKNPAARACVTISFNVVISSFQRTSLKSPPKKSVAARRGEPSKLNAKRQPERKLRSE